MNNVRVEEKGFSYDAKVHSICALSLPEVFQVGHTP